MYDINFDITRQWEIRGAPVGGTCSGNTAQVEKCYEPVIPVCKDRNIYCSEPPSVSLTSLTQNFHTKPSLYIFVCLYRWHRY